MRYRPAKSDKDHRWHIVLDTTPFYPEGGGQIGDQGTLIDASGHQIRILDTRKEHALIYHEVDQLPTPLDQPVKAIVDAERRAETARHHSATHLLHAALRQVLGPHVQQKGSLVAPDHLRFDFSHPQRLTQNEMIQIEALVNSKIREDIPLEEDREVPFAKAISMGATALFGEKYGERVRVIAFDPNFSIELCGGTHVPRTGTIGFFKIINQSAVGAGIRRIVAKAGQAAELWVRNLWEENEQARSILATTDTLTKAITDLIQSKKSLEKQLDQLRKTQADLLESALRQQVQQIGDVPVLITELPLLDPATVKNLIFRMGKKLGGILIFGHKGYNRKAHLWMYVDKQLTERISAAEVIRLIARHIRGGGGGQPFFATAGGKYPEGIHDALKEGSSITTERLTANSHT